LVPAMLLVLLFMGVDREMKIGDNVVIISKFGEFETNIEGVIISFYREDKAVVQTEAGHQWAMPKKDLRVISKKKHSTWNM